MVKIIYYPAPTFFVILFIISRAKKHNDKHSIDETKIYLEIFLIISLSLFLLISKLRLILTPKYI